jgi:hypothetical protein
MYFKRATKKPTAAVSVCGGARSNARERETNGMRTKCDACADDALPKQKILGRHLFRRQPHFLGVTTTPQKASI